MSRKQVVERTNIRNRKNKKFDPQIKSIRELPEKQNDIPISIPLDRNRKTLKEYHSEQLEHYFQSSLGKKIITKNTTQAHTF